MKKIGVILVNYKGYVNRFLLECRDSLREQTYPKNLYNVYIVDNASSEVSRNFIRDNYAEAIVVPRQDGNYAAANNAGIKRATEDGCQYFVVANMDTKFDRGWLSELIKAIESDPKIGIAQSKILLYPKNNEEWLKPKINSLGNIMHFLGFGFTSHYGEEDKNPPTPRLARAPAKRAFVKRGENSSPTPSFFLPLGQGEGLKGGENRPHPDPLPSADSGQALSKEKGVSSLPFFQRGGEEGLKGGENPSQLPLSQRGGGYSPNSFYQGGDGYPEIGYASGCSFITKREVVEKIGGYNEEYFMYHDDVEMSWKAKLAGYRIVLAPKSIMYHKYEFSRSIKMLYYMERNRYLAIFSFYRLPTLIIILPAVLAMDLGMIFYSAAGGWFGTKLKIYGYFLNPKNLAKIYRARCQAKAIRTVPDRKIIKNFSGKVLFQEINNPVLKYFANPLFNFYWLIIKNIIVW